MEVNAEATMTRKQPFWTWPKTRSKISNTDALQKKKEKKENRTRNHLSTFNQKYESQDHKEIRTENAATRGGSRIFSGGGALVSCSTSTPINHKVFFFLKNTSCIRKPQVISGGGAHPRHPPPRSAPGYSEALSEEKIIEQLEEALKALNRHSQRGTCPKTLQYKARADEAFKTVINKIRKTTEQEVVNYVLTPSSGTMKAESLNARTLKQQKRPILN